MKPIILTRLITLLLCLSLQNILAEEKVMPVSVVQATSGVLSEQLPLTGTIRSIRTAMISAREDGYVDSVKVDEGDIVKQGDILVELDDELARIEIARAEARLQEARARLKEFIRQRDETEELIEKNHIAATNFEAAAAQVEINSVIVKQLETELKHQQAIVKRHVVVAPFDGVVSGKQVEQGQWVETNTAVIQLVELNPLRINVAVPQFYFGRIHTGMKVKVRYDAMPNEIYHETITTKVPVSESDSRTFPIFIDVNNGSGFIAPGMSARVSIELVESSAKASLVLPRDAIVQKPNGEKNVWKIKDENGQTIVEPILVETGVQSGQFIAIKSDAVKVGDQIVIRGNEILRSGQAVNVITGPGS